MGFGALASQLEDVNRVHAGLITRPEQARDHSACCQRFPVDLPPSLDRRELDRIILLCHQIEYASATFGIRLGGFPLLPLTERLAEWTSRSSVVVKPTEASKRVPSWPFRQTPTQPCGAAVC
jgi:hypothetical protein